MGQAKKRGSFEDRKADAISNGREKKKIKKVYIDPVSFVINAIKYQEYKRPKKILGYVVNG